VAHLHGTVADVARFARVRDLDQVTVAQTGVQKAVRGADIANEAELLTAGGRSDARRAARTRVARGGTGGARRAAARARFARRVGHATAGGPAAGRISAC